MAKQKSKNPTKQNSQKMIKQNTKTKTKLDLKLYSIHLSNKLKRQKRKRRSFPKKNEIIKGKRVITKRRPQNHKKNNRKRDIIGNNPVSLSQSCRGSQLLNPDVKNNNIIINRSNPNNFNLESGLNICHSLSPVENRHLQFMNLNSENNRLKHNIFNVENFGFNFNIPLSIEFNLINEIPLHQSNDEELLDISALNNISCNHFNRIERNLFHNLPEVKIEDISNLSYENCLICLNNFLKDEIITTLPCSHIFHCACIREWYSFKKVCPLCRAKIK